MSETQKVLLDGVRQQLRDKGSVPTNEWKRLKATLTPEQEEWIRHKCNWEHMTWLGVIREWGIPDCSA